MYDVEVDNNQAVVTFKHHPSVTIPLDPPPAEKFAPGYTRAAWIWVTLNDKLENAAILLPQEDVKEIAILISQQKQ